MKDQLSQRKLTRREFMRLSALLAAGAVVSSCAPAPTPTAAPAPAPTTAPAAAPTSAPTAVPTTAPTAVPTKPMPTVPLATATVGPRKGGILTWGQAAGIDVIDPANPSSAAGTEIGNNLLDTLVKITPDQKVVPGLATKWTVENDAKKFTFTLREGVKFHDGTLLDAAAVKKSWDRILDPATKAASTASLLGPIDKIEAPDPKTIVVTFKQPFPLFLQQIWRSWFGILSPKQLDALKPGEVIAAPVGSGPFKFVNRSADGVVTLDAFADYAWGSEDLKNRAAPYLQSIKFRSVPETATRVATLESGENLLIDELSEADYNRLKADKRFRFFEAPRMGLGVGFTFNVKLAPTNDLAVRQAINWSVDRKSIVEKLFFGIHRVTVGPLTEGVWARLDELEKTYGYDPKKAQQILDDAGWRVGAGGIRTKGDQKLSLVLVTFGSPWTEMADAFQSQLRSVGIDVQVQNMARTAYLDFVRAYKHNVCQSAGTNFDPDELRVRYHSDGLTRANFANLTDSQLDALLVKGSQQAMGSAERRKTYEDAQRRLMELLPFVSVMTQVRVQAMAAKVRDFLLDATGLNAPPMSDVWMEG